MKTKLSWSYIDLVILFFFLQFLGFVVIHYILATFEPVSIKDTWGKMALSFSLLYVYLEVRIFVKIMTHD